MTDAQAWLLKWFEGKGAVPGETLEARLKTDYVQAGLIDSLTVVQLVADLEKAFSFRFEDRHFQENRFSTIGGLSEMVAELAGSPR